MELPGSYREDTVRTVNPVVSSTMLFNERCRMFCDLRHKTMADKRVGVQCRAGAGTGHVTLRYDYDYGVITLRYVTLR